jgi:superfamily II DNA or RNA helicase
MDNSQLSAAERRIDMDLFRSGSSNILVAVRTIDEGIDVPDAKLAIIVNGTSSSRQRIQRIGRVVRPTGESAVVVSILARNSPEEFRVGARDFLLVGRERTMHHLWNGQPMDELMELSHSTYTPTSLDNSKLSDESWP